MSYGPYGLGVDYSGGSLIPRRLPKDGNAKWEVTTEPALEPVTLDELKEFARISYDAEDTLLEGFITAARRASEDYVGRAFITQTIRVTMDFWPSNKIELPRPPLISIVQVATQDEDDTETVFAATNYYIITGGTPGLLALRQSTSAPVNTARDYGGFIIDFTAGYGAADDVPQPIREAVKIWAASIQANRKIDTKNPPPDARALLDLYRRARQIIR